MFPEARNQILIRIENIDDLFDTTLNSTEATSYSTFNVKTYATELYSKTNGGTSAADVTVTERTLINNQDYADWQTEKYAWKSVSDSTDPDAGSYPADTGDNMVLQPQRIRLFRVNFTAAETIV